MNTRARIRGIVMLRPEAVGNRMGVVVRTVWEGIKLGILPPPVKIGPRAVAIPEHEVDAVLAARIAGKSEDDIRALVKRLVAKRATLMHEVSGAECPRG